MDTQMETDKQIEEKVIEENKVTEQKENKSQ